MAMNHDKENRSNRNVVLEKNRRVSSIVKKSNEEIRRLSMNMPVTNTKDSLTNESIRLRVISMRL